MKAELDRKLIAIMHGTIILENTTSTGEYNNSAASFSLLIYSVESFVQYEALEFRAIVKYFFSNTTSISVIKNVHNYTMYNISMHNMVQMKATMVRKSNIIMHGIFKAKTSFEENNIICCSFLIATI